MGWLCFCFRLWLSVGEFAAGLLFGDFVIVGGLLFTDLLLFCFLRVLLFCLFWIMAGGLALLGGCFWIGVVFCLILLGFVFVLIILDLMFCLIWFGVMISS